MRSSSEPDADLVTNPPPITEVTPVVERAIARAMQENGLETGYRVFVVQYLTRADSTWRRCCDSGCEPCVMQLARVVDRTRELLDDG